MKNKNPDYSKRTLFIVGSISLLFALYMTSLIILSLETPNQVIEDVSYDLNESDIVSIVSQIEENSRDINVDVEVSENEIIEIEHGWIINDYGYTYVYGDRGFQQFNYKQSALQRYVDCINALSGTIPQTSNFLNLIVPISTTFADIPREIYKEDNFFNLSQSSFVATVERQFDERVSNINIVNKIETAYDSGEYVYFRTDSNWTSLGAYNGYLSFCEAKNIEPKPLDAFKKNELGDFLGGFYRSTSSVSMYNNPDDFICYSTESDVATKMTVYDNDMVFVDYNLCENGVGIEGKYNVYLGRDAGRYSISTNSEGGSILIIGDSSVAPLLPFIASHYKEIEFINPQKYNKSLSDFLSKQEFDDIITICYSSNAISGEYIPSLINFTGVKDNE